MDNTVAQIKSLMGEALEMLQIGVPIMAMRAVNRLINVLELLQENDPTRIGVYMQIAYGHYQVPKFASTLIVCERGIQFCERVAKRHNDIDEGMIDKLGRQTMIQLHQKVSLYLKNIDLTEDFKNFDMHKRYTDYYGNEWRCCMNRLES